MRVHMKPHVVCLMASSVDGRTLHSRWRPDGRAGELFEQVHDELADQIHAATILLPADLPGIAARVARR